MSVPENERERAEAISDLDSADREVELLVEKRVEFLVHSDYQLNRARDRRRAAIQRIKLLPLAAPLPTGEEETTA